MDELIKSLRLTEGLTPVVTIWSVLIGCSFSALLTVLVGMIYRRIHGEASYSQALVHTFVLLSIGLTVVAVVGSLVPAMRATALDPTIVLRSE